MSCGNNMVIDSGGRPLEEKASARNPWFSGRRLSELADMPGRAGAEFSLASTRSTRGWAAILWLI